MRKVGLALAGMAAWLAASGGAWAQTDPATWVHRVLGEWDSIQAKDGWTPQGEVRPGRLASGAEARLEYRLAGGSTYRFVVVCEPSCGAGDVELFDPAGARVGEPRALVEMPKVEAAPAAAGTYVLRVAMTDCAAAACSWSARLYVQGPTKPRRRR
jgi:hypothetical protein